MTSADGIHSCSYYCERPACVLRQRDTLREIVFALPGDINAKLYTHLRAPKRKTRKTANSS